MSMITCSSGNISPTTRQLDQAHTVNDKTNPTPLVPCEPFVASLRRATDFCSFGPFGLRDGSYGFSSLTMPQL